MSVLSEDILDALKEIINIGVGKAAGTMNELLGHHILLEVPQITIIQPDKFGTEVATNQHETVSLVTLEFSGQFSGITTLLFTPDSASKLIDLLVGEENALDELDAIKTGTLTEVGNILLNAVMGSIGNVLKSRLSYTLPTYREGTVADVILPLVGRESSVLEVTTRFTVQDRQIVGEFLLMFEVGSFERFIEALDKALSGE